MRLLIVMMTVVFLFSFIPSGQASPYVSANNAILMEQESGRVLFEKSSHEERPIASITKIMTAVIALEHGELDDKVKASRRAIHVEGSSIYLEMNEKMSLEDLLYGLMLRSGNDAANAIAEHIGGSIEGFVYLMNEKAAELGMTNTHFTNPHGLHDDAHYSTAYDMALLTRYAMTIETFQEISNEQFHKPKTRIYGWKNKNRLVNGLYEYSTGGKTGFTKRAGRTLVSTAANDSLELIAVTLNAPNDWNDHIQLFNWGFKHFTLVELLKKGKVTYPLNKGQLVLDAYIENDIWYPLTQSEFKQVKQESYIKDASLDDDKIMGKTVFTLNGTEIGTASISKLATRSLSFPEHLLYTLAKMSGLRHYG